MPDTLGTDAFNGAARLAEGKPGMSTTWIRVSFAVLLGLVLAVSAGFGVLTFESGPRPPQPVGLSFSQLNGNSTDQDSTRINKQIDGFYSDNQTYREKFPDHQRNIFLWFAGIGIVLGVIGVALPRVVNYLRLGFVFGGLLLVGAGTWYTLQQVPQAAPPASSLLALFSGGSPKELDTAGRFLRFAVSIVGLLVLLFTGLWRLTDWQPAGASEGRQAPGAIMGGYAPGAAPMLTPYGSPAGAPTRPSEEPAKWARPDDLIQTTQPPAPPVVPAQPSAPAGSEEIARTTESSAPPL